MLCLLQSADGAKVTRIYVRWWHSYALDPSISTEQVYRNRWLTYLSPLKERFVLNPSRDVTIHLW
ncbi:hypothetical protein O9992_01100 [Vibrio lentus]|nr:hypothetical protein [Vibrio lentus]